MGTALVLLLCAAGCRGLGGTGGGENDAGWFAVGLADASETPLLTPVAATRAQAPVDSSPVGAVLSRLLCGDEPEGRSRHVRVEPVPILGAGKLGFSLTLHW